MRVTNHAPLNLIKIAIFGILIWIEICVKIVDCIVLGCLEGLGSLDGLLVLRCHKYVSLHLISLVLLCIISVKLIFSDLQIAVSLSTRLFLLSMSHYRWLIGHIRFVEGSTRLLMVLINLIHIAIEYVLIISMI